MIVATVLRCVHRVCYTLPHIPRSVTWRSDYHGLHIYCSYRTARFACVPLQRPARCLPPRILRALPGCYLPFTFDCFTCCCLRFPFRLLPAVVRFVCACRFTRGSPTAPVACRACGLPPARRCYHTLRPPWFTYTACRVRFAAVTFHHPPPTGYTTRIRFHTTFVTPPGCRLSGCCVIQFCVRGCGLRHAVPFWVPFRTRFYVTTTHRSHNYYTFPHPFFPYCVIVLVACSLLHLPPADRSTVLPDYFLLPDTCLRCTFLDYAFVTVHRYGWITWFCVRLQLRGFSPFYGYTTPAALPNTCRSLQFVLRYAYRSTTRSFHFVSLPVPGADRDVYRHDSRFAWFPTCRCSCVTDYLPLYCTVLPVFCAVRVFHSGFCSTTDIFAACTAFTRLQVTTCHTFVTGHLWRRLQPLRVHRSTTAVPCHTPPLYARFCSAAVQFVPQLRWFVTVHTLRLVYYTHTCTAHHYAGYLRACRLYLLPCLPDAFFRICLHRHHLPVTLAVTTCSSLPLPTATTRSTVGHLTFSARCSTHFPLPTVPIPPAATGTNLHALPGYLPNR